MITGLSPSFIIVVGRTSVFIIGKNAVVVGEINLEGILGAYLGNNKAAPPAIGVKVLNEGGTDLGGEYMGLGDGGGGGDVGFGSSCSCG